MRESEDVVVVDAESKPALSTITTTTLTSRNRAERESRLKALRGFGVVGRKAEQLARLKWATAEYIRAHMEQAEKESSRWENPVGMAIYRIEGNLPVPMSGREMDDDRRRYIRGEYAEFIEH